MKKGIIFMLILSLGLISLAQADLTEGLVGYWPFDGDSLDASGQGRDGVPSREIVYVDGILGQAMDCDGQSGAGVNAGPWKPSEGTGQLSVSCWAKWRPGEGTSWQGLVGQRNGWGENTTYWFIECSTQNDSIYFQSYQGGWHGWGGWRDVAGQWNHVVASFDGTTVTLYVNNEVKASGNFTYGSDSTSDLTIGRIDTGGGAAFDGVMDEVAVWDRPLTAEEVAELYNDGAGITMSGNPWKAENVSPANGISGVPPTGALLQWGPPTGEQPPKAIASYDVFLGTDKDIVKEIDPNAVPFATVLATDSLEVSTGALEVNTVYYWRVDAVIDVDPNIAYGKVWTFDTTEAAPVIVSNPASTVSEEGSSVSLQFVTASYTEVTYTWFKEGAAVSVASGSKLELINVSVDDEGLYYCQAQNSYGMVESTRAGFELPKLLAHYKLDDTVASTDEMATIVDAGDQYDGIEIGEVQSSAGMIDGALAFDGAGDYVDTGTWNPNALSPELSVSLWAKWNGPNGGYQGLIGKRDAWSGGDMMWQIEVNNAAGEVGFKRDGSEVPGAGYIFPVGEWTHYLVAFDGTTGIVYVNGLEMSRGGFSFGSKTDAALVFGACEANGGNPFNGELDDVRIYNYALDPVSVAVLYTSGSGNTLCYGGNPAYDFDGDCKVALSDFAIIAAEWLGCNWFPQSACP